MQIVHPPLEIETPVEQTVEPTPLSAEVPESPGGSESSEIQESSEVQESPEVPEDQFNPFSNLGLNTHLSDTVTALGYLEPTAIQEKTIPILLSGNDVLGQAQTGTGKTAAFALPILDGLDMGKARPQCLVLAPTRELAIQVGEAFKVYGSSLENLNVATICGGQEYQRQIRQLRRGAQIVVGTPGRVIDLVKRKELKIGELRWAVLDEADEMLRMGFEEDVRWILSQTPKNISMALFSATLPDRIQQISKQYLKDPVQVTIKRKTSTAETIDQKYIVTRSHQKKETLIRILEGENIDGVMVFVKTRSITEPLAELLQARLGYSVAAINGDIPQARREQIIANLKSGKTDIIVATDVAARGLDIDRISHVINYDLPQDVEGYIHRIGRTGRAGRTGSSILFLKPDEQHVLENIIQSTKKNIDLIELPSNRQINHHRVERFHQSIVEHLEHPQLDKCKSVVEQLQATQGIDLEMIAASLAVMANGGKPFFQNDDFKLPGFVSKENGQRRGNDSGRRNKRFGNTKRGNLKTYRMEIGSRHHVKTGNIVGAIANEVDIDNESIGRIKIFAKFSIIDLPDNLTPDQLDKLGKISIGKRPLKISEDQGQKNGKPRKNHESPKQARFNGNAKKFSRKPKRGSKAAKKR